MYIYICIYYNHICLPLSRIYRVLYCFYIYYTHTCIPLSKAYRLYMYTNMYIFMYCNHICIALFIGFIVVLLSCRDDIFYFFSLFSLITVIYSTEADLWLNPNKFIPDRGLRKSLGCWSLCLIYLTNGLCHFRVFQFFSTFVDFQSDEWH